MFGWDGIWEVNPRTTAYLASNPGSVEIMRICNYPKPIHEIGYFVRKQGEFRPAKNLDNVLFAPIHPLTNGYLNPYHRNANIRAFEALLEMPIKLTVRHIDSLASNGLWHVDGVEFIQGKMDCKSTTPADMVVSYVGTYLSMMVAEGTPIAAFGQDYPHLDGYSDDDLRFCKSWDKYSFIFDYPFDISDGYQALEYAAKHEATKWRRRFVGDPFTVEKLDKAMQAVMDV